MTTSRWKTAALLSASLLLVPLGAANSQTSRRAARNAPSAAAQAPARVDPQAVQALRNMSAYLRTLTTFEIRADTTREEVDRNGQKLQFSGTIDYKVRRPNGLLIQSNENGRQRQLIYDGKTLVLYTPERGYYARVAAPPTIRETLALAADRYDIHPPLVDLFKWGNGEDNAQLLTSGYRVGGATVDGQPADQYAFRQNGVDWQIWIAKGDRPLPLRAVVTTTSDPVQPQFRADLNWKTAARFADNTFVFQPPADAKQIGIASLQ
jgi:hypothetical protein